VEAWPFRAALEASFLRFSTTDVWSAATENEHQRQGRPRAEPHASRQTNVSNVETAPAVLERSDNKKMTLLRAGQQGQITSMETTKQQA
jgi:hypothetical protein